MEFTRFVSFRKLYLPTLVMLGSVFLSVWGEYTVFAQSFDNKAVSRFYQSGKFDPQQISEDELYKSINTAYEQATEPDNIQKLAERLLKLKWWRLWESNFEMAPETIIVSDPLGKYFHPSENWQWSETVKTAGHTRSHHSSPEKGITRHSVKGIFPSILPANGTLLQEVYFPADAIPKQIWLRVETGYLGSSHPQRPVFVQARWTKTPEQHFSTENRPNSFWAGTYPPVSSAEGGWYTLSVNLVDLGLCGRHRSIKGIEYIVRGGQAWFGRTIVRRPKVELRGTKKYQIFAVGDELSFDIAVHNFSHTQQTYTLHLTVSNYAGAELLYSKYEFKLPPHSTRHKKLTVPPGNLRYLVVEYTLNQEANPIYHGYSSAAVIIPNTTGRKPHSKFGMMYWDQPGKDMVELYEKLGVKLVVIFPEIERLHRFDSTKFDIIPMFWALPESHPKEGEKLRQDLQPYLQAGQNIYPNFWETDLRVPSQMFAPNMQKFSHIIKTVKPAAIVGIGGMAWFNVAYLTELLQYAKDSPPFFDFMAVMLYNTPSPPEYSGIDQETEALTSLLKAYGTPQTELWNVEWTYFENINLDGDAWLNTGVPRHNIAPYTIRHHLLGFASGISRMIPGTQLRIGRPPLAKNYGHSMVLGGSSSTRYDLTPLPILPAYSVMTRMLEGKNYVKSLGQHPNVRCQVYRAVDDSYNALSGAKTVLVAWSLFGTEEITLKLPRHNAHQEVQLTLLNMLGEPTGRDTYNGELHLNVSPEPTYILLPDELSEHLDKLTYSETPPILTPASREIENSPGTASTVDITYRLFNPGENTLQGTIKLTQPNWIKVVSKQIHYSDESGGQFVSQRSANPTHQQTADTFPETIRLESHQHADVTFTVKLPEHINRKAYYEEVELTQNSTLPLVAEFFKNQQSLACATTTVRVLPPLHVRLRPVLNTKHDVNNPTIRVSIENTSAVVREGTLHMKVPGPLQLKPFTTSFSLSPGQTYTADFSLTWPALYSQDYLHETVDSQLRRHTAQVTRQSNQTARLDHYRRDAGYLSSFGIGEGYAIEALVRDQTGYETRQLRGFAFRPAVKAKTPIIIDGNLNDWTEAVPLFVDPSGRLSGLTFFAKDYGGEMQWRGSDDFSSAWQTMWDENYFYLAVKVFDDHLIPQHNLGEFWNGDTISFQIDPLPNLTDASPLPTQRDLREVHTFDVGLSRDGVKFRRKYPTQSKRDETMTTPQIAVKQDPDGILYEIAIPWDELSPLRPKTGKWMGFSLVFYEDDGNGRETRSNWFGGTGGNGLAREPRLMGDVHFVQ